MKPKNQGKSAWQTAVPQIETMEVDREMRTRNGVAAVEDADSEQEISDDGEPTKYLGNRTPCPHCGAILLQDRSTQACVVMRTMPEKADATGVYVDRYMVCKSVMCGGKSFLARERISS
jgi:hypothetical protein